MSDKLKDTIPPEASANVAGNPPIPVATEKRDQVSWSAILLGLVLAIAFQILMGLLGLGLGFTIIDPSDPLFGIGAWGIGTALYVVIIQLVALFLGGYAAARLNRSRTDVTAMFHGAAIWALATISMVGLGTTGAGMAISGLSGAVASIGSATGSAVRSLVPDDISQFDLPEVRYLDLPEPVRDTLRENDISANQLQQEIRGVYRETITRQEEQRIARELEQTVTDIVNAPADALEEIDETIDRIVGKGGVLSQRDLQEMQDALQQRLNLSDSDVRELSELLRSTAEDAREQMKMAVRAAREESIQAAEAATDQIAFMAFWLFLASLAGLIAAVAGGKKGELHV